MFFSTNFHSDTTISQPLSCLRTTATINHIPKKLQENQDHHPHHHQQQSEQQEKENQQGGGGGGNAANLAQITTKNTMDDPRSFQDQTTIMSRSAVDPDSQEDYYSSNPTTTAAFSPPMAIGEYHSIPQMPFHNPHPRYYTSQFPPSFNSFDMSARPMNLSHYYPDPHRSAPNAYRIPPESPSAKSFSSAEGISPFPGKQECDDFTPDSATPEACYNDLLSDAQVCVDMDCHEGIECGPIVTCTEPSCTLENSSCGGSMSTVAVKAATYLQSAPSVNSGDWHFGSDNASLEFSPITSFGDYGASWPSPTDALHNFPHDSIPIYSLPDPQVLGPFLDGGSVAMDHRPKRLRREVAPESPLSFPAQPMLGEHMNPGLDSLCGWQDCFKSFDSPIDRDQHVHATHFHSQISLPCPRTECPDFSGMDLSTHLKRKHDSFTEDENCYVKNCVTFDASQNSLEQHMDQKHSMPVGNGVFCAWKDCNESGLVAPEQLANHLQDKHNVRIWASHVCQWRGEGLPTICGARFDSSKELQEHAKSAHLADLSKKVGYICRWDGCDRALKTDISKLAFAQRGKLERHLQSHTKYKACTCSICNKEFSAEQALEQHMRTHDGTKPFKCTEPGCGKAFAQASALTMHKRTHTGEKPLKCSECGKQFAESSNLSKHRKTHNKVGQYACEHLGCGRTFHRPEQLRKHNERHLKEPSPHFG